MRLNYVSNPKILTKFKDLLVDFNDTGVQYWETCIKLSLGQKIDISSLPFEVISEFGFSNREGLQNLMRQPWQ